MEIIEIKEEKSQMCETILRALPYWFGIESTLQDYVREAENMPMLAAKKDDKTIGF